MPRPTLSEVIEAASKAGRGAETCTEYLKIEFSGTYLDYQMEFPKGLNTIDRAVNEIHRWATIPGEAIEIEGGKHTSNNLREYTIKGIFNYDKEMLPILVLVDWINVRVSLYRPIIMSPKQFIQLIKESNAFDVENNEIKINKLTWDIVKS